jgi:hypothetical protein
MTTDHKTRSMPRAVRHLYRSGLPAAAANWRNCTAYLESFRGLRPDSGDVSRVPATRAARRRTNDLLRLSIENRARLRPSPLILADSLREMLAGMACPVARAIISATESAYDCATRLPGNHYAWRETAGKVSYCPRGKVQQYIDGGRWARAGRQDTTPARFARAVLPARVLRELGDAALSTFAQRFAAAEEAENVRFEVWTEADEINDAYRAANYVSGPLSEIDNSCMVNDPVGAWYARAGARLLVARTGRGLLARALLWTLNDGRTFLDRVYSRTEAGHEAMQAHAIAQGWLRRAGRSISEYRRYLLPDGAERCGNLTVETARTMDPDNGVYVPYHDTFCRLSECGGYLHNDENDDGGWRLRYTNGTAEEIESHTGQVETAGGDWINEDDACTTADGDTYHCDDVTYCDEDGEYYLDDDGRIAYCDTRDETILSENARRVEINGRSYVIHVDDIEGL